MKSVFLRRMLVVLILVIVLAFVFTCSGYMLLSRNTYIGIKMQELLPKAEVLEQLVLEYRRGDVTEEGFKVISDKVAEAAGASTFMTDQEGEVFLLADSDLHLSENMVEQELSLYIERVLAGEPVQEEGIHVGSQENIMLTAVPIEDETGIVGSVIMLKSNQGILNAISRLNSSMFTSIAVAVPLIILFATAMINRMTSPLHQMSEVAIEMSRGNFDVRADDSESGEVGLLARALNTLCENLSRTIYQLRTEKGQLDQLLSSLTDGVAAQDGVGMLTHYNPALMKMFGAVTVEKREDLIPDPEVWAAFDRVYGSGEGENLTLQLPGEKAVWVTISPVTTEEGERTGVVGLFKDMTEVERLEAMRREYVANISHELRTPLTAVRGLLEPLADGMIKDEETRVRYYRIMLHEVMRLSRLITDMMTLSRLQSGTEYMELSRVDVDELVTDLVQGYQGPAQKKGINLVVDAPDMPDALTDPDRVEQVLVILVDNAMRYTPEGGSITLRVRNSNRLIVSVEDTGCGIPEADLPYIFERFYKVDKSRREGGTGLGLSIAKYIMEKLGERIEVESELGKGTRFTFTLKKYTVNAIALGPAPEEKSKPAQTGERIHAAQPTQKNAARTKKAQDAPYEVIACSKKQRKDP